MNPIEKPAEKKRIDIIDALRGLSVILMVIHHLLFDLVEISGRADMDVFKSGV